MLNKRLDLMNFLQLADYREIFQSARWQTEPNSVPLAIREWLCHTGSLTQKLQQTCDALTVEIIQEGWQNVSSLPQFAKKREEQTAWKREVILKRDEIPTIFAQTILAEKTVQRVAQEVLTLGDAPIGLWLFPQNPHRLSLEWAFDAKTKLYARRSYFLLHGYPFAIYELFLPQFSFEPLNRSE